MQIYLTQARAGKLVNAPWQGIKNALVYCYDDLKDSKI